MPSSTRSHRPQELLRCMRGIQVLDQSQPLGLVEAQRTGVSRLLVGAVVFSLSWITSHAWSSLFLRYVNRCRGFKMLRDWNDGNGQRLEV